MGEDYIKEVNYEVVKTYLDLLHRKESISEQMELLDNEYHVCDFILNGVENGTFKLVSKRERRMK